MEVAVICLFARLSSTLLPLNFLQVSSELSPLHQTPPRQILWINGWGDSNDRESLMILIEFSEAHWLRSLMQSSLEGQQFPARDKSLKRPRSLACSFSL